MLLPGPGLAVGTLGTNALELASGETWIIAPAGQYTIILSRNHSIQYFDPVTQLWQSIGSGGGMNGSVHTIFSDGVNFRLANQTGCPVGAILHTAGSGYSASAPPTVTAASSGGSKWRAIVGGAVNTTVTVANGGQSYTYPPIVVFQAPPNGGLPATGYATLSSGAVSTVTVTNQGAGYLTPPTVTFLNDPREVGNPNLTPGYGAVGYTSLTGGGTVVAVVCTDHGTGSLSAVPSLTFSSGSAAATAIMDWTITAYTIVGGSAGAGLTGTAAWVTALEAFPTVSAAYTNPKYQSGLVQTRMANIYAPITSNAIVDAGQVVYDGGCYTAAPIDLVVPTASVVTTQATVVFTMGGTTGLSFVLPNF